MRITQPSDKNLLELMSWFNNKKELSVWTGPNFRYPFNLESFKNDLRLDELKSFFLISDKNNLLAFGQYYLRLDRCHLGRLVVNPELRGQGIVSDLIKELSRIGKLDLKVDSCSLFVLEHNESAIQAYKRFGFSLANYPEEMPLKNCLYMVKS